MLETYIYFSFEDFKENYQDDLKDWLTLNSVESESLYLEDLKTHYSFFIGDDNNLEKISNLKIFPTYIPNVSEPDYINLNSLAGILEKRINIFLNQNKKSLEDFKQKKKEEDSVPFLSAILNDSDFDINNFDSGYLLDENSIENFLIFFEIENNYYLDKYFSINVNWQEVKKFELTIKQILNFINDREDELNNTNLLSIPNLPESSIVEKVIYLHELGVIDFLIKKQPFNTSANKLATVLGTILKEESGTLQPYLNALINGKKGIKNHPYNSDQTVKKIKALLINEGFK